MYKYQVFRSEALHSASSATGFSAPFVAEIYLCVSQILPGSRGRTVIHAACSARAIRRIERSKCGRRFSSSPHSTFRQFASSNVQNTNEHLSEHTGGSYASPSVHRDDKQCEIDELRQRNHRESSRSSFHRVRGVTRRTSSFSHSLEFSSRQNEGENATDLRLRDEQFKVAILRGNGNTFCAGADLAAVTAPFGSIEKNPLSSNFDDIGPMGLSRLALSKPTIAAISGYCLAGVSRLSASCGGN